MCEIKKSSHALKLVLHHNKTAPEKAHLPVESPKWDTKLPFHWPGLPALKDHPHDCRKTCTQLHQRIKGKYILGRTHYLSTFDGDQDIKAAYINNRIRQMTNCDTRRE